MDTRSSSLGGACNLYGVAKTLRKLYVPQHEPSHTIEQALATLAFMEAERGRIARRELVLASVA